MERQHSLREHPGAHKGANILTPPQEGLVVACCCLAHLWQAMCCYAQAACTVQLLLRTCGGTVSQAHAPQQLQFRSRLICCLWVKRG